MGQRLIYADAIEKVLEEKHFKRVLDSDRWLIADIKKSIMDLPTVDAVPSLHLGAGKRSDSGRIQDHHQDCRAEDGDNKSDEQEEGRMKCEKCGKELESLEVDMFERDGSDDWYDVEINEDHGVVMVNVTPEWTGDGLSEEEYHETIRCPHCRQFPFIDKFVDATTFVSLVMYPRGKDE